MKIKDGGKTEGLTGKIKTIRIEITANKRSFQLWINEDSLSYLPVEELLDLRDEVNNALKQLLK